jgi:hypothetical protein
MTSLMLIIGITMLILIGLLGLGAIYVIIVFLLFPKNFQRIFD